MPRLLMSVPGRHARRVALMLMMAFALVGAGQEPADADAALRRARERLLADLKRMPRYTCVQTINRQYFRPRSDGASCATLMAEHEQQAGRLVLRSWDRLRLEVAIVEGNNVYSWVGAPRFEGDTLEQFAEGGPLSSGDFGPFLHSIFNLASITFKSEELAGHKRLLAYSYDMPVERSRYSLKGKEGWVVSAYNGSLVIDPDAGDLVSLTVRTAELPESNPACQAISEVEYGRTQIHDRLVLIPRQTRLITINRPGSESRSVTTYSNCREYSSTSKLFLEGPPGGAANSSLPVQQSPSSTLPAGLHFRARIVTSIDSNTAAGGDPIEAVLLSPIRGENRREWAAAGARLHGRLLRLGQSMSPSFFQVLVQFESIEVNGSALPLRAAPDLSGLSGISTGAGPYQPEVSVIPDRATLENVFIFRKQHLHLEKFDWHWTTLPEHQVQPRTFPGWLHFRARIVTPIDSDTAVVGDPIEAVLLSPIPGKDGREWAPAGARLNGHLLALKQYELKSVEPPSDKPKLESYVEVLVQFDSIELDGSAVPLRATPDLSNPFGFEAADGPSGQAMSVIPDEAIGENFFLFHMKHLRLANFDWGWTTLPAQQSPRLSPPRTFPAGQHFRARIVTPIDSDTAVTGDWIEAVLLSPITGKDGREWAPAGAHLHGHLLGLMQKQFKEQSVVEVLMQFESIELNGSDIPFLAAPESLSLSGVKTGAGPYVPEVLVIHDDLLKMNFFRFREQHLHLDKFDWDWTTLGVPQQQKEKKDETGWH